MEMSQVMAALDSVAGWPALKAEPCEDSVYWESQDTGHRIKLEGARSLLYADHEVKDEMVIGPTEIQPRCAVPGPVQQESPAAVGTGREYGWSLSVGPLAAGRSCSVRLRDVAAWLRCAPCGQWCLSEGRLAEHSRALHTRAPATVARTETVTVTMAGTETVPRHRRIHTGKNPFRCDHCHKRYTSKSNLVRHIRIHTGENLFSCDQCDKRYTSKCHLVRHIHVHTGEKPFRCDQCGKQSASRHTMDRHLRNHTGEKLFSCDQCDKGYNLKGDLVRHIRVHTGEKFFGCDYCKKWFTEKYNLVSHIRLHTGEKPFICDQCDKKFAHRNTLSEHLRVHSGKKLFICGRCDKRFYQNKSLLKHIRVVHAGEKL